MTEYLFLLHDDAAADGAWEPDLRGSRRRACFDGGSEIVP